MKNIIKGCLTICKKQYNFIFEGQYLYIHNKERNIKIGDKWDEWNEIKSEIQSGGSWILAYDGISHKKYYFHCLYPVCNQSIFVDYYAVCFDNDIQDFGRFVVDGFVMSEDFIGEYIKNQILVKESSNSCLTLTFPTNRVILSKDNIEFLFGYNVLNNPKYYGLSSIKPTLTVVKRNTSIDDLIEIYENIIKTFSFLFRKNTLFSSSIVLLKKEDKGDGDKHSTIFDLFFTNNKNNKLENYEGISSTMLPYFKDIYALISNGELSCSHIPSNKDFDISHLIMMYSWFEKLYKTLPCNSLIELKSNARGKLQLYWRKLSQNKKRGGRPVSCEDQLKLVLQENPELHDNYALSLLMALGGWFFYDDFIDNFAARVSNYRNDIIHNDDIIPYPFIMQDTYFLELIIYYLIFKYKCNCSEADLEKIITILFHI